MSTTLTGKRSHTEALADAEAFRALFPIDSWERWEFAGSLRRQVPHVGDVEHVIQPRMGLCQGLGEMFPSDGNLLWAALDRLLVDGTVTKHLYGSSTDNLSFRWGEKYRGVDFRGFNHEIFLADEDNWANQLLIRTGPAEFSQRVVTRIKAGGRFRQHEGYLIEVSTGRKIRVKDERAYLSFAQLGWFPPEDRK